MFLNQPHPAVDMGERTGVYASSVPPTEIAGSIIAGKYKLLLLIGEGGIGTV